MSRAILATAAAATPHAPATAARARPLAVAGRSAPAGSPRRAAKRSTHGVVARPERRAVAARAAEPDRLPAPSRSTAAAAAASPSAQRVGHRGERRRHGVLAERAGDHRRVAVRGGERRRRSGAASPSPARRRRRSAARRARWRRRRCPGWSRRGGRTAACSVPTSAPQPGQQRDHEVAAERGLVDDRVDVEAGDVARRGDRARRPARDLAGSRPGRRRARPRPRAARRSTPGATSSAATGPVTRQERERVVRRRRRRTHRDLAGGCRSGTTPGRRRRRAAWPARGAGGEQRRVGVVGRVAVEVQPGDDAVEQAAGEHGDGEVRRLRRAVERRHGGRAAGAHRPRRRPARWRTG